MKVILATLLILGTFSIAHSAQNSPKDKVVGTATSEKQTPYVNVDTMAPMTKLLAIKNAMIKCDSETIQRVADWDLQKVQRHEIESVQEEREGPIREYTTTNTYLIASAEFRCLKGPKPQF